MVLRLNYIRISVVIRQIITPYGNDNGGAIWAHYKINRPNKSTLED